MINLPENEIVGDLGGAEPVVLSQPSFWRTRRQEPAARPSRVVLGVVRPAACRRGGLRAVDRAVQPASRVPQRPHRCRARR